MDRHQITDRHGVADLLDADDRRLRVHGHRDRLADLGNRSGAAGGLPEDREPLPGANAVIAAAIDHHQVAGRAHLPSVVPEHEVTRIGVIGLAAERLRRKRRLHVGLEIIPLHDPVARLRDGRDRRVALCVLDVNPARRVNAVGLQAVAARVREAIAELTRFVEQYPTSPLIEEGRTRLREAKDRRSDADFRVGYFYLRTQKFPPAAIDRFNAILKSDPEYTRRDAVYFYLAQALIKMKREVEALPYLDRLVNEFEYSEHLEEAKKLAETLKADMKKTKNGSLSHDS